MDNNVLLKIDSLIDAVDDELAADTVRLVNIKSTQGEAAEGAPFGIGPKKVLDEFAKMGNDCGFYTTDYNVGVISVAMEKGQPDLGIWLHGDVVPEGDGWVYEPYNAVRYNGCIIGRGAGDNKGQLAAIFNLFKTFKRLGVKLNYNAAIYLGSNEETGMKDILGIEGNSDARGFINVCTPPRVSLVPDGGFPVGYGGKGGLHITLKSATRPKSFSIIAGQEDSPGTACAVLESADIPEVLAGCTVKRGDKTEISAFSSPRHASSPDPNGNMITVLSQSLLDAELVDVNDRYILEFIKRVSLDIHGEWLGIKTDNAELGSLTVFPKRIDISDGYPELVLNIRYPVGITCEQIKDRINQTAEKHGFSVSAVKRGVDPYLLSPTGEIVEVLLNASSSVMGVEQAPFTMSGGTYAHVLPNAYVFGSSSNQPPKDFPAGHGGVHGIDEAVSLERLRRAMKIYARALLSLNDISF